MTTLREAAQQALEALEESSVDRLSRAAITALRAALAEPQTTHSADCYKWHHQCAIAEVQRLRAALAEQALDRMAEHAKEVGLDYEPVQEPVVWQWMNKAHFRKKIPAHISPRKWRPLYTAPPRCPNCASLEEQNTELDRKLADRKPLTEEEIWRAAGEWMGSDDKVVNLARAVEAAHGIIETKIQGDKA